MTTTDESTRVDAHAGRKRLALGLAAAATLPGLLVRYFGPHGWPEPLHALLFGFAIVGAAFLLAWGAEAAQLDISAGAAIAVLAFIAVLPEYAVDMVFSWKGGKAFAEYGTSCKPPGSTDESPCSLALANMTGANRLLIGIGWPLVVGLAWLQWRRRGMRDREVVLERTHSVELTYLAIACAYALTLPLKRTITLIDGAILVLVFVLYTVRIAKAPPEEPHLVGPAALIGGLSKRRRRLAIVVLLVVAAAVILACAEHFAESLVASGRTAGVSEFLLVQWLAPLASEAPELLIAGMFAWRLNTNSGLGTLVSSKVNQWTLLVGTLPAVFALASGSWHGLPLDGAQREELFLTGAQAVFAVAVLASLSISIPEAILLFGLFWAQFIVGAVVPPSWHGVERIGIGVVYLVLAAWFGFRQRTQFGRLVRDGIRTPYAELTS